MEVFGTAAASLELVKLTRVIIKNIRVLKHAPKDASEMVSELECVQTLLRRLERVADDDLGLETHLAPVLSRTHNVLRSLDMLVNRITSTRRFWRTNWLMQEKEASKLCRQLRGLLLPLNIVLNTHMAATQSEFRSASQRTKDIERKFLELIPPLLAEREASRVAQTLESNRDMSPAMNTKDQSQSNVQALQVQKRDDSQAISVPNKGHSERIADTVTPTFVAKGQIDHIGCQAGCHCLCHQPWIARYTLAGCLAQANIRLRGIPLLSGRCSSPSCAGPSSNVAVEACFRFPPWLLSKAVSLSVLSNRWHEFCLNVNVKNVIPRTHRWFRAVEDGNVSQVQWLIRECPSRVNDVDEHGRNALAMLTYQYGDSSQNADDKLSSLLLESGGDAHIAANDGTSFHQVCVTTFLLYDAVKHTRTVAMYCQPRISEIWEELPEIHRIVLCDLHTTILEHLSTHPQAVYDRDRNGRTALVWAVSRGNVDFIRVLLLAGADIDACDVRGQSVLHFAIRHEIDWPSENLIIPILLDHCPNLFLRDRRGMLCLHLMPFIQCPTVRLRLIDESLQAGVHPGDRTEEHDTVLTSWAACGDINDHELQLLMEAGADIDAQEIHGLTALACAITYGRQALTEVLLKHGANPRLSSGKYKQSILHQAARFPDKKILEILLDSDLTGVQADLRDINGETPANIFERKWEESYKVNTETRTLFYTLLSRINHDDGLIETDSEDADELSDTDEEWNDASSEVELDDLSSGYHGLS